MADLIRERHAAGQLKSLSASRESRCSLSSSSSLIGYRGSRAFTLLETLMVLVIMALGFVFVAPNFSKTMDSVRFRSAVREVASGLRQVRGIALSQGREAVFFMNVEERLYRIDQHKKSYHLPDFIDLKLETAESELSGPAQGNIRFYPNGSATGGRIVLSWGERRRRVDVNWLTGRVTTAEMDREG